MWRQVVPRSPQNVGNDGLGTYLASIWSTHEKLDRGASWSGHERNCVFLNTSDLRFANISAVSGLDFDDDGRGLARPADGHVRNGRMLLDADLQACELG